MCFSFSAVCGVLMINVSECDVVCDPGFDVFDDTRLSLTSNNKNEIQGHYKEGTFIVMAQWLFAVAFQCARMYKSMDCKVIKFLD